MSGAPAAITQKLRDHGQEHVLAWWDRLAETQRQGLPEQLAALDFEHLRQLYAKRAHAFTPPPAERIAPVPVIRASDECHDARGRSEESLRRGLVADLLVEGGQ